MNQYCIVTQWDTNHALETISPKVAQATKPNSSIQSVNVSQPKVVYIQAKRSYKTWWIVGVIGLMIGYYYFTTSKNFASEQLHTGQNSVATLEHQEVKSAEVQTNSTTISQNKPMKHKIHREKRQIPSENHLEDIQPSATASQEITSLHGL